jgi:hypothetical protein
MFEAFLNKKKVSTTMSQEVEIKRIAVQSQPGQIV